jgi:hypothetical protein
MKNDEFLPGQTRPSSLRAVHKLATPDPLYDLRLRRELEIANARMRIELVAAGSGAADEPRRKTCVADSMHLEKQEDIGGEEEKMSNYQNLAMAAVLCVTSGCNSDGHASPKPSQGKAGHTLYAPRIDRRYVPPTIENGKLIMPFFDHSFSASCYDTLKCRVLYDNAYVVKDHDPSGPLTPEILKNLSGGWGNLGFPTVAHVVWTSLDGDTHEEKVDLSMIFKSRLIRYSPDLDVNSVDLSVYYMTPDIILVIENRTIYVYMKALIPLLKPVDPNNKFSDGRVDMVLAYEKTI